MKVIGILLVILALVVGVVPQFTDCQSQGRALTLENGKTVAMKCHWTGEAELALAIPMLAVGIMMIFYAKRKDAIRVLAILGIVMGILVILIPTVLIGVCALPDMLCNSLMKPILILSGILITVLSGVALARTFGEKTPQSEASEQPK
jgi:hypothetical protein